MTERERLIAATARYEASAAKHEADRVAVVAAVVAALKAGMEHTEAAELSPWTDGYLRKIRRDAKLPGAKTGPKPKMRPTAPPAE